MVENYFRRDSFIFVGKSNRTKIPASEELYVAEPNKFVNNCIRDQYSYLRWEKVPSYMSDNLLSTTQLEDLAKYCEQKNMTLFDFLFNVTHFGYHNNAESPFTMPAAGASGSYSGCDDGGGTHFLPQGGSIKGKVYLVTGKGIDKNRQGDGCSDINNISGLLQWPLRRPFQLWHS